MTLMVYSSGAVAVAMWHKIYSGRPVSVSGFIPGFSVFVKSPVSVPVSAPEMHRKHRKSLPNGRQQEPQGGGAKRRPLGAAPKAPPCCLPFGKDFLCFGLISGAHPEAFPPSFFWDCPPSLVFPERAKPHTFIDILFLTAMN